MSASAVEIVESDVGETAVLFVKERARRYSEVGQYIVEMLKFAVKSC